MQCVELDIQGVYLIDPQLIKDERGFFARTFCRESFERHGMNPDLVQCNISFNYKKGTLRGMHFQCKPHEEAKVVRCTKGAIYDVVVDLRPGSKTYCRWAAVELSAENRRMLYIPEGIAHGFQTLADNTEVFYQMSYHFVGDAARGVRWDDAAFQIEWPEPPAVISQKDLNYPDFAR